MDARISYYEPILALAKAKEEKAFALQKSWLPANKPEMTKSSSIGKQLGNPYVACCDSTANQMLSLSLVATKPNGFWFEFSTSLSSHLNLSVAVFLVVSLAVSVAVSIILVSLAVCIVVSLVISPSLSLAVSLAVCLVSILVVSLAVWLVSILIVSLESGLKSRLGLLIDSKDGGKDITQTRWKKKQDKFEHSFGDLFDNIEEGVVIIKKREPTVGEFPFIHYGFNMARRSIFHFNQQQPL
ncbi:hypothetical protein IGI04_022355 [Brassica rapa subsp. trilocularis]|uniref:Uncharacterized protein n=1 Tax=Brassica rapa subsp. trilocularis TaxID=1813537 RepID=A0ABQ7M0Q6_BRACM|nr:hypothetical protein IGI04_022355 [Brassica rapa subsp. trilocularis]